MIVELTDTSEKDKEKLIEKTIKSTFPKYDVIIVKGAKWRTIPKEIRDARINRKNNKSYSIDEYFKR